MLSQKYDIKMGNKCSAYIGPLQMFYGEVNIIEYIFIKLFVSKNQDNFYQS